MQSGTLKQTYHNVHSECQVSEIDLILLELCIVV